VTPALSDAASYLVSTIAKFFYIDFVTVELPQLHLSGCVRPVEKAYIALTRHMTTATHPDREPVSILHLQSPSYNA
jgi:hypothetical protein